MRNGLVSLISIVLVVLVALVATIAAGYRPLLGIDLTGGVEVVLQAVDDPERDEPPTEDELDQAVEILRNRVDGLDVAQPDITRQGSRIVVQLPDVEDQQRAIELVGTTAELQFRPVCALLAAEAIDVTGVPPLPDADEETGYAGLPDGEYAIGRIPSQDDTEAPSDALNDLATAGGPCAADIAELSAGPSTPTDAIRRDEEVVLDQRDEDGNVVSRYYLGVVPSTTVDGETVYLTGTAVESASAVNTGFEAVVSLNIRQGEEGITLFNGMAVQCYSGAPDCPPTGADSNGQPRGRMAIVLDGNVESAPTISAPGFERGAIQISGAFSQEEAENVALVLRYGSLPVELEQQQVRTVSASLGSDSLRAGIISGAIGLLLVAAYMIFYYRLLGVAALLSLVISGTMLWVLISFFSETGFFFNGVTLTIAGVVGLIVSMGVSLDSNVVYFEHLKEDIANGRTLRSAIDRSFPVAFRTIFYADMAALIGAVILYTLTSASVREFALMLGLASVLDLVATYFFLRPLVRLMARSQAAVDNPGLLGLPDAPQRARS